MARKQGSREVERLAKSYKKLLNRSEEVAEKSSPGILGMMEAYGRAEEAAEHANTYLDSLAPHIYPASTLK